MKFEMQNGTLVMTPENSGELVSLQKLSKSANDPLGEKMRKIERLLQELSRDSPLDSLAGVSIPASVPAGGSPELAAQKKITDEALGISMRILKNFENSDERHAVLSVSRALIDSREGR